MAIARVGTGSGIATGAGSSTTLVINYTPAAAGNTIIVIGSMNESTVTSVKDSTNTTYTLLQNSQNPSGSLVMTGAVAYRANIPAGLTSFTITSGINIFGSFSVEEWSGIDIVNPQVDAVVNSSTATNTAFTTGAVTPTDPNALVVYAFNSDDNLSSSWTNPPTGGTPAFTQLIQFGDTTTSTATQTFYHIRSSNNSSQSAVVTYAAAQNGYVGIAVNFNPTAAPPPPGQPIAGNKIFVLQ